MYFAITYYTTLPEDQRLQSKKSLGNLAEVEPPRSLRLFRDTQPVLGPSFLTSKAERSVAVPVGYRGFLFLMDERRGSLA